MHDTAWWQRMSERLDAQFDAQFGARPDDAGDMDDVIEAPPTSRLDRPAFLPVPLPECGMLAPGFRLGVYEIVEPVGRGGMGDVYRARRADGQFDQQVAVKILRPDAVAQLERFQAERQILARFDHPGIMRIHDGGVMADGTPFMVMEYVTGEPITEWCRRRGADLASRLDLFVSVCDAVAYAHRALIVHRDLKPGNILVSPEGRVKILDFGIARQLSETGLDETRAVPFSLGYAAPEQITGGATASTMTDVYALGTLLFELLAGQRPWSLERMPMLAAIETVLHRIPPAPSRLLRDGGKPAEARNIAGDLDAIVARALNKEPQRRYLTVDALVDDIRRARRSEPVLARERSRRYVVGRFLRRHRLPVASLCLVLLALSGGLAGMGWQYLKTEREARRADTIKTFLISLFADIDGSFPINVPRRDITADTLMTLGVKRIDTEFAGDPQVQMELLKIASDIYSYLSDAENYDLVQNKIVGQDRKLFGEVSSQFIIDDLQLAKSALYTQRWDDAGRHLDHDRQLMTQLHGTNAELDADLWNTYGEWLKSQPGRSAARMAAYQHAIEVLRPHAAHSRLMLGAQANVGALLYQQGDIEGARRAYEAALATPLHVDQENIANLATTHTNLGTTLATLGDFAGAEHHYIEGEKLAVQEGGKQQQGYWFAVLRHATLIHRRGDWRRADAMFDALLGTIPAGGDADSVRAVVNGEFATCLAAQGDAARAVPMLQQALDRLTIRPFREDDVRRLQAALGDALDRVGRFPEARAALSASLASYTRLEPASTRADAVRERWARFLVDQQPDDPATIVAVDQAVDDAAHKQDASLPQALAWADKASLALHRHDLPTANRASQTAMDRLDAVRSLYDIRDRSRILLVRSKTLLASGDHRKATDLAKMVLRQRVETERDGSLEVLQARMWFEYLDTHAAVGGFPSKLP